MMPFAFNAPSDDKSELEDAGDFTPRFDDRGLITAIVTDVHDGEILMVAHMNAQALALTIQTGKAHYFSRSRGKLWMKGETSGNIQTVKEIRTDCDQDAIWLKVEVAGHDATCHTGRRSCFYRTVTLQDGKPMLDIVDDERHFDPKDVYGK
ncbi:phosphoribosyl-AMP cyclohydrolase [Rhizobium mongolense]|jgi:phosphoribosyl-AMP cyclohydrolase|uniref:Phosphoribosyl-AMP cyclohydrolase n=2 Tax=Rhizobium gallicum TaxID=56730 RepID=A0A0B4X469_9HYPH|nr:MULTISPECIES: phosphoribosyl-AMP cyclohydrolase [Rhizobium]OWK25243.1 phosphoribosyl-AMP cyclohydrolase [Rhizobium yanglingense]AJD41332.1 phosphoribosyl-AMP cyclohydrolase [Rhizobium gallicum bv. gallicum R602sp]APO67724.1 phosphoribosyl-AMP cyclohydrolase [Rhizobium gallicum]NNH32872.1 phosphoribosyl-AMP cyclohydrolase [Rhizobium sp. SEMIA 4085]QPB21447.1 phosphoribosyl-AMP cyclohydrolase [Rhizobium sp. 007]